MLALEKPSGVDHNQNNLNPQISFLIPAEFDGWCPNRYEKINLESFNFSQDYLLRPLSMNCNLQVRVLDQYPQSDFP